MPRVLDPTYPQRFKEAGDKFTQKVEDTLHLVGVHGVERPILHKGRQVYARFRQAEMQAARTLEDEAVRRAHEGLRKPVWYKGKIVGYETEYSDTLLLAVLKANNPDKFRDRLEQTNVLEMDPDKMSPELLDKIADHLLKKALGENAPIAEINRRLAAGEDVTFEEAKAIEAPGEPLTIDAVCQAVNEPTRTTLEPEESQKPDSARHSRDGPVASTSGSMVGWHRNPLGTGD